MLNREGEADVCPVGRQGARHGSERCARPSVALSIVFVCFCLSYPALFLFLTVQRYNRFLSYTMNTLLNFAVC